MSGSPVRWDALTYDGTAPGRNEPSLHIYVRPDEQATEVLELAQRLFQDFVSRFYSGPPFLTPEQKLEDTVRNAVEDRTDGSLPDGIDRIRMAVAIVDRAGERIHLFRRGDIRLFHSGSRAEILPGEGSVKIDVEGFESIVLLDGSCIDSAGERFEPGPSHHGEKEVGRVVIDGVTAGVLIPLGRRPAPAIGREADPVPQAAVEGDRVSDPAVSKKPKRSFHVSIVPMMILLLLFLMAVFWRGWKGNEEEPGGRAERVETVVSAVSEEQLPSPAGSLVWDFSAGAAITSSPRLAGNRVVFGSRDGNVYTLNIEDGETVWSASNPRGVGSSPAIELGKVFFGNYGGDLVAVSFETGKELWRRSVGGRIVSSPCCGDSMVFFGSFDRCLYALHAETGEVVWRHVTGGVVWSSPRLHGDLLLFASWDGNVYALRTATGEEVWSFETGERVYASPAIEDGEIYIGSTDKKFYRLDAKSGEMIWAVETGAPIHSTAAVSEDRVVFGTEDGTVHAVYRETGEILWSFPTGARVPSSPAIRNGIVYVTSYDYFLYALDLDLGHPVWRVDIGASIYSSPTVGENHLFFGTNGGRFLAIAL